MLVGKIKSLRRVIKGNEEDLREAKNRGDKSAENSYINMGDFYRNTLHVEVDLMRGIQIIHRGGTYKDVLLSY